MKRISLLVLASVLFPLSASAAIYEGYPFPDVPSTHPNAEAITYVRTNGIVQGYADGSFHPDRRINRAEFTKIMVEATGSSSIDEYATGGCFTDVGNEWFGRYVCYAKAHAIISGYGDGTFRPDQAINLSEAAKIMVNTFLLPQGGVAPGDPWYKRFVEGMEMRQAIPLTVHAFSQKITRGEMAEMVYRIRANITDKPSQGYAKLAVWKVLAHSHGWQVMYPGDFQPSVNTMQGTPEDSEDVEIQPIPTSLITDPSNGVSHRKSLEIAREGSLREGQAFSDFAMEAYGFNQARGYAVGSLEHRTYAGAEAYEFTVNHGYATNATDGFLIYPERRVVFLLDGAAVYRIMFPKEDSIYADIFATFKFVPESEGCPAAHVEIPTLSLMQGAKPFVLISWNREVASRFNIYRSDSGSGTWTKLFSGFPNNAGSAVDTGYPKADGFLFYRVAALNAQGEECRLSEKATIFVGNSPN